MAGVRAGFKWRIAENTRTHPDRAVRSGWGRCVRLTCSCILAILALWFDNAHKNLDAAVFAAYGWPVDLSDDDILARLLALNLEQAA